MRRYGFVGRAGASELFAVGDVAFVSRSAVIFFEIPGLEDFLSNREGYVALRKGATFAEGLDLLYVYDRRDGYGYAINLDVPRESEWGYTPFALDLR